MNADNRIFTLANIRDMAERGSNVYCNDGDERANRDAEYASYGFEAGVAWVLSTLSHLPVAEAFRQIANYNIYE